MFKQNQIGKRITIKSPMAYIDTFKSIFLGVPTQDLAEGRILVLDENAYVIIGVSGCRYVIDGILVGERVSVSNTEQALRTIKYLRNGTLPDKEEEGNFYFSVGRMAAALSKGRQYQEQQTIQAA